MKKQFLSSALAVGAVAAGSLMQANPAQALTFFGSGTNPATSSSLSASASFNLLNNNRLEIVLTNTGSGARNATDVLTGLFWDIVGNPTLNLRSAQAPQAITPIGPQAGQDLDNNPNDPGNNEWRYAFRANNLSNQVEQSYGLGTARFGGIFDFPQGTPNQDDWGIINGFASNAPRGFVNNGSYANNSIRFVLGGLPLGFDLSQVGNVRFQYGTNLANHPNLVGSVPSPAPVPTPALLPGLIGMGVAAMRKRKKEKAVQEAA
jgi:hypothetical protein